MMIKQKHYPINFTDFRKRFGNFSVNFRLTVSDSYLNKYPTILVQHFSQVYLSKHPKSQWLLNLRSNTALDEPRTNQSNCYTNFSALTVTVSYNLFFNVVLFAGEFPLLGRKS